MKNTKKNSQENKKENLINNKKEKKQKKQKEPIIDESRLEKAIEELSEKLEENEARTENINLNDFTSLNLKDFLETKTSTKKPILERIAGSESKPIFFRAGTVNTALSNENQNEENFNYVQGRNIGDKPKYIGSNSKILTDLWQIDIINVGRKNEPFSDINQNAFFEKASEIKNYESQSIERVEKLERFNIERVGRGKLVGAEEAGKEKYKSKLP